MRRRSQAIWVLLVAALLVVGSLFAMTVARGAGTTSVRAKSADSSAHPMARMTQRRTSVKRILMNREGTVQPGAVDGAVGTCPKKYTPVSGWFSAKSDKVVLAESLPIGTRKWATAVVNFDTVPSEFIVGIVCVR